VRAAAGHRCGYCLSPQFLIMARLEIEHIIPRSRGGTDDELDLWLGGGKKTSLKRITYVLCVPLCPSGRILHACAVRKYGWLPLTVPPRTFDDVKAILARDGQGILRKPSL
jgi:hypothetical protein